MQFLENGHHPFFGYGWSERDAPVVIDDASNPHDVSPTDHRKSPSFDEQLERFLARLLPSQFEVSMFHEPPQERKQADQ